MSNFSVQAAQFKAKVEEELAEGRLIFPVSMEVSLRVKRMADDPDSTLDEIAAVVQAEPVLSAKVLRMANTVVLNPYGASIQTVREAVARMGLSALRSLAIAVASEQLVADKRSPAMKQMASDLWNRTIDIAAWCFALARQTRVAKPDAAMLAGMMSTIGQFFLIARSSDYPAMEQEIDRFAALVDELHTRVGLVILEVFDLPETVLDSIAEQEGPLCWPPAGLEDLLSLSQVIAEMPDPLARYTGRNQGSGLEDVEQFGIDRAELEAVLQEAQAEREQILSAVRG